MTVTSLHKIVANILLKRRYSWHYYLQFLVYAKDGLREIAFDENILTTRYKCLPVDCNNGNTAELPNDYQDYTRVSVRTGQYIRPLVEDGALQLVPNYDSNFDIQPYNQGVADPVTQTQNYSYGYASPYWWMVNWNSWGENIGRQFGGVSTYSDTFKIDKARNQIKINEDFPAEEIILEYISDGQDADSATHIDSYAQMAIEIFCMWQFYLHNRTYSQREAGDMEMKYVKERQILRARLSDLTIDKLKRIVQGNTRGIKY